MRRIEMTVYNGIYWKTSTKGIEEYINFFIKNKLVYDNGDI